MRHKTLDSTHKLMVLYHIVPNATLATLLVRSQSNIVISSHSTANKIPPVVYNITTNLHLMRLSYQKFTLDSDQVRNHHHHHHKTFLVRLLQTRCTNIGAVQ